MLSLTYHKQLTTKVMIQTIFETVAEKLEAAGLMEGVGALEHHEGFNNPVFLELTSKVGGFSYAWLKACFEIVAEMEGLGAMIVNKNILIHYVD